MSPETRPTGPSQWNGWHRVTIALLAGLAAASFMFFAIAAVQTSGLDPPPETVALFVVATTANVIAHQLLRWNSAVGYPAAMLAGGVVLAVVAVIVGGTYGAAGPRTNPVGPLVYVALAVTVIITAGVAWLRGPRTQSSAGTSSTA